MDKELVSIIVPLYNYKCYIEENIQSIITQDYTNHELIIVDDNSLDNPYEVVKKYISDKVKYLKLPKNVGYSIAKNEGILISRGKFIVVLDADDILAPHSLSVRIDYLNKCPDKKWVHGLAYEFCNTKPYQYKFNRRKYVRRFEHMQKTGNFKLLWQSIHAQTVMVHRSVYQSVGLYEETMRSMSDKEMWARIQHNVGLPGYVNEFIVYYRRHDEQMHLSSEKKRNLKKLTHDLNRFVELRRNGRIQSVRQLVE